MTRLTDIEVAAQAQALRLGTLEQTLRHLDAQQSELMARLDGMAAAQARSDEQQRSELISRLESIAAAQSASDASAEAASSESARVDQAQSVRLGTLEQTLQHLGAQQSELIARLEGIAAAQSRSDVSAEAAASESLRVDQAQSVRLDALEHTLQQVCAQQLELVSRLDSDAAARAAPVDASEPAGPPAVEPYSFQQLLYREVEHDGLDLVAHVHIPKSGGHTVNVLFRQMGFLPLDLDMNTNSFFGTIREDRWWEAYRAPPRRASYLLTGHMRLDHPIFRKLWIRHVIVSVLRDPVQRMLSNYNFTLRRPGNPWYHEVVNKGLPFLDYCEKMIGAIGPQYSFFDDTGAGSFACTGSASPEHCLNNLLTKVGIYGLTDRFNEFVVLAGFLFGRKKILAVPATNVTSDITESGERPLKSSLTDDESRVLARMLAGDIWFYDEACKEYERRISDPTLHAILAEVLPLVQSSQEMVDRITLVRDPRDPDRRAFVRP